MMPDVPKGRTTKYFKNADGSLLKTVFSHKHGVTPVTSVIAAEHDAWPLHQRQKKDKH